MFFPQNLYKHASAEQEASEIREMAELCGPIADMAINDDGLPTPTDTLAAQVVAWCKHGSWSMCTQCHSVQARRLEPSDLRRTASASMSPQVCTACKHQEYVPQLEDIPVALQRLRPRVLAALRPLDVDTGVYQRAPHGYRVHTAMIRFSWATTSVDDKIQALPKKKDRRRATKALRHLLTCTDSAYKTFYDLHLDFLRKHGTNVEEKMRKLPLSFLETPGLECAVWPELYWHRNLCETVARANHENRRKRRRAAWQQQTGDSTSSSDGDEPERAESRIACSRLGRIKRGFLRKVLSPVIGYGLDYTLLHFVYDLSMWTTVGTKKNIARQHDAPLRLILSSCPWTPQYWRIRHQAVIDMQRQCGNAALFRTRAPYERSFPYHQWVLREQRAAGRARQHLAGAETLHQAHVLLELDRALFAGARCCADRKDRKWTKHLLAAATSPENTPTVLAHVTRLEFQDGKRKQAKMSYHGRGTTHSHSLDFLENKASIQLETKISASVPDRDQEPLLHGLVLDGQRDYKSSGLPVRELPSVWDEDTDTVLLHHSMEDKELCVRPYFPSTMAITKCHEDVQQGNGNGAVLRYVATYQQKFSDSMDQDWLNDAASDYSVARRILCSYHPLEPEMWLTLAQERFPQIAYTGSMVHFMVPLPGTTAKPDILQNYELSTWRREDMNFLEFLRKTNASGAILRHLREKHKHHILALAREAMLASGQAPQEVRRRIASLVAPRNGLAVDNNTLAETLSKDLELPLPSLENFANDYMPRGEKLIAAGMYSMLSDKYYGQWLVLHRPFRQVEELDEHPQMPSNLPDNYRHFALALLHAPAFWRDHGAIQAQMALEANSRAHIETILHKVEAQTVFVDRLIAGDWQEGDPGSEASAPPMPSSASACLTPSQERLRRHLDKRIANSLAASQATTDEQYDLAVTTAASQKILFATGPPGTGKTYAVHDQIEHWNKNGARILFVLPTGQLAARMRARHPAVDVDTFHGGLLFYRDISEALGIFTQYDFIIMDEVSMLTATQFERVLAMWQAAEKLPCLLLLGDFWQLPIVDRNDKRCDESTLWCHNVHVIHFREQVRCKDPRLQEKLLALRTSQPSVKQLAGWLAITELGRRTSQLHGMCYSFFENTLPPQL